MNVAEMRAHVAAIQQSSDGAFVWGPFEVLLTDCMEASQLGRPEVDATLSHLRAVANRLTDLRTCAMKLQWMRDRREEGELDQILWMYFASSDVLAFLASSRSLFDDLARAFRTAAPRPAGIPRFSFNKLRSWALKNNEDGSAQLGATVHQLVVGCDWFDEIRLRRGALVHGDAQTIVFPTGDGVPIQVYDRARDLISEPELMATANVARFDRFAAAVTARLHVLVNASAQALSQQLAFEGNAGFGRSVHGGLSVLANWTDDYLANLRS